MFDHQIRKILIHNSEQSMLIKLLFFMTWNYLWWFNFFLCLVYGIWSVRILVLLQWMHFTY